VSGSLFAAQAVLVEVAPGVLRRLPAGGLLVVGQLGHLRYGHVGWPEGVSPSGSRRSRRDNLSSPGSCHPDHQEPCTHAQWAKSLGYWRVMRCQHAAAFVVVRNRLYFLRIHRIR
jgi:hypothetical protein